MATRGRKPKPTALKLLEGNPGKRPINEHEPIPPKGTVKCPTWLEPEAKKEWKRLAPSLEAMGVLTLADITAFEGYCQAYARWKEAEEFITQHGAKPCYLFTGTRLGTDPWPIQPWHILKLEERL